MVGDEDTITAHIHTSYWFPTAIQNIYIYYVACHSVFGSSSSKSDSMVYSKLLPNNFDVYIHMIAGIHSMCMLD